MNKLKVGQWIKESCYSMKEAKQIKGALVKIVSKDNYLIQCLDYKTKEVLNFDENILLGLQVCDMDKIVSLIEVVLYG